MFSFSYVFVTKDLKTNKVLGVFKKFDNAENLVPESNRFKKEVELGLWHYDNKFSVEKYKIMDSHE